MTTYQPLEDRCLIRPIKSAEPERTAAGIITETIKKDVLQGEVVAVGEGFTTRDTGVFVQTVLRKGDIVLYGASAGVPLDVPNSEGGKDECRLMREGDVLVLIKKAEESN